MQVTLTEIFFCFADYCECRSVLQSPGYEYNTDSFSEQGSSMSFVSAQGESTLEPALECSNRNASFHEICNGTLASPCDCVTSAECQVIE